MTCQPAPSCDPDSWKLIWPFGAASVRSSAAILKDCEFRLPSGRRFAPLARAPWADDPRVDPALPAHMRHLGGEFVCLPFGLGGRPADLLPEWDSPAWQRVNAIQHGLAADANWQHVSADASHVCLSLSYPPDHDIESLTRRVSVDSEAPALDLELAIHSRRPSLQPVGLHPILRLPDPPATLRIGASFEFGITYPAFVPPGVSRLAPGRVFEDIRRIPGASGEAVDYSILPKSSATEEMFMLCNVRGPVTVYYPEEQAYCRIYWDTSVLPCCLIWPSDRSIQDPPWNGTFRGVGIEPVAAVFDAAREVAIQPNPLSRVGIATAVALDAERPLQICYRIEAGEM